MCEKTLGRRYCRGADPVAAPILLLQRTRYHGTPIPYLKPLDASSAEGSQTVIRSAKRKDIGVEPTLTDCSFPHASSSSLY